MEAGGKIPQAQEDNDSSPRSDMEEQTKDKDDSTGVISPPLPDVILRDDNNMIHSQQTQPNNPTPNNSRPTLPEPTEGRSVGSDRTGNNVKNNVYKPPLQDPLEKTTKFLVKHNILGLFQNLTASLAHQRPGTPLQFMIDEIEKLQEHDRQRELAATQKSDAQRTLDELPKEQSPENSLEVGGPSKSSDPSPEQHSQRNDGNDKSTADLDPELHRQGSSVEGGLDGDGKSKVDVQTEQQHLANNVQGGLDGDSKSKVDIQSEQQYLTNSVQGGLDGDSESKVDVQSEQHHIANSVQGGLDGDNKSKVDVQSEQQHLANSVQGGLDRDNKSKVDVQSEQQHLSSSVQGVLDGDNQSKIDVQSEQQQGNSVQSVLDSDSKSMADGTE